jgi:hypothetical protein
MCQRACRISRWMMVFPLFLSWKYASELPGNDARPIFRTQLVSLLSYTHIPHANLEREPFRYSAFKIDGGTRGEKTSKKYEFPFLKNTFALARSRKTMIHDLLKPRKLLSSCQAKYCGGQRAGWLFLTTVVLNDAHSHLRQKQKRRKERRLGGNLEIHPSSS